MLFINIRWSFVVLSTLVLLPTYADEKTKVIDIDPQKSEKENFMVGSICLGEVLNKARLEEGWEKKQAIQINSSEKIDFQNRPKIIAKNLDVRINHKVKIFFDDIELSSWNQTFAAGAKRIKIYFKPGYWRAETMKEADKCE